MSTPNYTPEQKAAWLPELRAGRAAGKSYKELSKEFPPSDTTIRDWLTADSKRRAAVRYSQEQKEQALRLELPAKAADVERPRIMTNVVAGLREEIAALKEEALVLQYDVARLRADRELLNSMVAFCFRRPV